MPAQFPNFERHRHVVDRLVRQSRQSGRIVKRKADVFAELADEIRAFQTAVDAFDEAAATRLELNRTDLRCVDILGAAGRLSAGQIAERMHMTTGAVTTMLDRLERQGMAQRTRDDHDRRRVHVELTPAAQERIAAIYDELILEDAIRRASAYTVDDLDLIVRFLQDSRATYEQALDELAQRPDAARHS